MRTKLLHYRYLAFFTLLAACLIFPQLSMAAGEPDDFIRTVGQNAIDSLTDKTNTQDQREESFRKIIRAKFDLKLLARFTLGRFWRRTSEEQQREYSSLFEDFIVKAYAARFANYNGENFIKGGNFVVGKVRKINERDNLVQSEIVLADRRRIPIHWRVRNSKELKIVDVIVEGVSMAITQRDEFSAIINQNGGKIDGLLAALRKKTGK